MHFNGNVGRVLLSRDDSRRSRLARLRHEDRDTTPGELANAYGETGNLLLAARDLPRVEAYYLNAQALAPGDRRWSYYLGHLYRNIGPLTESVAYFEHARQLQPDAVATLVWLGEVYLAQGRADAAAALFAEALTLEPDSAAGWFGAGRAARARDEHAEAVAALEAALARDPQATAIHYPLAMAYRDLGDLDQAQAHLGQRGGVEPRPADPLLWAVDELLESPEVYDTHGARARAAGNWAAAADYFEKGLALEPDNVALRHRLGTALLQMGDPRGAEEQFERVIRTAPDYVEAYYRLGMLMAASGRPQDAIAQFSTALEYEPGYVEARVGLARVVGRNGRPDEALAHYAHALELDPANAAAALGHAMNLVRLERYQEARDRLTDGMQAFPEHPAFTFALARLLAAAPDDLVRDGRRALTLAEGLLQREQSLALGETVAMALAELGRYAEAAAVQRDVRATAEQGELDAIVRRMTENLGLYERGQPSRRPFAADEIP